VKNKQQKLEEDMYIIPQSIYPHWALPKPYTDGGNIWLTSIHQVVPSTLNPNHNHHHHHGACAHYTTQR